MRPDWEEVKLDVMERGLRLIFDQHLNLRQKLIETGERQLVEKATYDGYWGNGKDGNGKNMLGKILMKLRKEYRDLEATLPYVVRPKKAKSI